MICDENVPTLVAIKVAEWILEKNNNNLFISEEY